MPASRRQAFFTLLKVLFSVWIVYHLFVMILMPNAASYPGRTLGSFIRPYAAVVGLNASWNFFSPDPAHTMYLKFTLYNEDADGNDVGEAREVFLPAAKGQGDWNLGRRRELYEMRFMLDNKRIDGLLGPWLCRHYAPVTEIKIEHILDSIPSLDEAVLFQNREVKDLTVENALSTRNYRCSEVGNEVSL